MDPYKRGSDDRRYNELLQQLQQQMINYKESTNTKLSIIEEMLESLAQEVKGNSVDDYEGPPVFDEDPNNEDYDLEEQKIILAAWEIQEVQAKGQQTPIIALELFDKSSKKEEVNEESEFAEKYAVQGCSTTHFFVEGDHKPDYGQRTKDGIVPWNKKKVRPGIYSITTADDMYQRNRDTLFEIMMFDSSHDWGGDNQAASGVIKTEINVTTYDWDIIWRSTVISLIERFYEPLSGHILLDGVDIRGLEVKWLRHQIGLVNQEALDRVMVGRTTIVVVHRLSTIRNADVLAVIQNGKIVETGSHDELISKQSGVYSSPVQLQEAVSMHHLQLHSPLGQPLSSKILHELAGTTRIVGASFRSDKESVSRVGSDEEEKVKSSHVSSRRLYSMVTPDWMYGVSGTICVFFAGSLMSLFALGITQALVSYYMDWDTTRREVKKISLLFCGGAVVTVIIHVIVHLSFGIMGERLTLRVRERMFSAILKKEIGWFDNTENTSSMLSSRLESDATLLRTVVVDRAIILIQNVGLIITSFIITFILNWRLTLVVIATYPLIISGHISEKLFMKGYGGNLSKVYLKANMLAGEAVNNIRTVAAICSEEKVLDLYGRELVEPSKRSFTRGQIVGIYYGVSKFFIFSAYGLALRYGSVLIRKGLAGFKSVMKSFMVLIVTALAICETLAMAPDLLKGNQMVASVFELLDHKTEVVSEVGEELTKVDGTVELRDVQFCYSLWPDVLISKEFDLRVHAGKTQALVGQSGCGKNSVLALILRFYDPWAGKIIIDAKSRNSWETYIYNMKNQINDKDKLADKLESGEKEKIDTGVEEALEWLDDNQSAEKKDYDEKLKEVEAVCNPIITAVTIFDPGGNLEIARSTMRTWLFFKEGELSGTDFVRNALEGIYMERDTCKGLILGAACEEFRSSTCKVMAKCMDWITGHIMEHSNSR